MFDGLHEFLVRDLVFVIRSCMSLFLGTCIFLGRVAYKPSSILSLFMRIGAGLSGSLDCHIYPSCKLPRPSIRIGDSLLTQASIGIFMGVSLMIYSTRVHFAPAFKKHGKAVPEQRLPPMIVGAIALPIALFWFGWTSSPNITWVPQVISSAFIGMGMLVTFWQGMVSLRNVNRTESKLTNAELHHRLLRLLCELCDRCEHFHTVDCWRSLSVVRHEHVSVHTSSNLVQMHENIR